MVDDDFRLLGRSGKGCACPLHMAEFNKRAGTDMTREELWSILSDPNHPDEEMYVRAADMPDGSRTKVDFTKNGEALVLDCPCYTLDPVILFIY